MLAKLDGANQARRVLSATAVRSPRSRCARKMRAARNGTLTTTVVKQLCDEIPWCEPAVLEPTLELALEIAREGREGRRIGTIFTLGRAEAVLAASRAMILDPLAGHAPERTHITDANRRGQSKSLPSSTVRLWSLNKERCWRLVGTSMRRSNRSTYLWVSAAAISRRHQSRGTSELSPSSSLKAVLCAPFIRGVSKRP